MENHLIGETIVREATDSTTYTGFWMPRLADEATYGVDVVGATGAIFEIAVQTKNSEDADSAATVLGSFNTMAASGVTKWTESGAKEWVRYVIKPTGSTAGMAHFQFLAPQWVYN